MATKLQHPVTYPLGIDRVRAAVSDRAYWEALAQSVKKSPGEVRSVTVDGDTVAVELTQRIPSDKLPSVVTSMVNGDLSIERSMTWTFTSPTSADGRFSATVPGTPATTEGTFSLREEAGATVADFSGSVTVRIPLVGGKIEKMISQNMLTLFDAERDFTVAWDAEKH
ncbi:DUF2505 domain-containing protein [Williamsia deligens]|uniref:DUF2505 domain-containing protein n=1 Tax=Williamsia deligens TaxID=321325 RepID=A0ABW3G6W3_9NOCA|nr:DUF2505 domain-containing protein [Williamsia deligens]MCP2193091.1 Protein of unknown function (DUF2505) [Williamsia deligens]